jgi:glucuronate isomerase
MAKKEKIKKNSDGMKLNNESKTTKQAALETTLNEIKTIFTKVRSGKQLNAEEILKFKSYMLYEFAIMDHEKGWVQQFHLGAIRNNNPGMQSKLGADTGFDSIGDFEMARSMTKFFGRLTLTDQLTKTIIYNLNPRDNELFATMIGNYNGGDIPGKIQWGSAWWFLDQKDGMEKQMNALSNLGLISRFVGMLTDSRSFLSYSRHEYFRRILCNLFGRDVENGELPNDTQWIGKIIQDICYNNANNYFKFR